MAIEKSQYELFRIGTDFEQIHFLDNFYENVNIDGASDKDVADLLQLAIKSGNDYIRRSACKLICELTLINKIGNPFLALGELHNLLKCDNPTLQVIAIKYLPYFQQTHNNALTEQLKELSDNPDGDVASQAYFCLGLFQITEAVSLSTLEKTIIRLGMAESHFQAASHSTENRVDADFYLLVIQWLKSVLSNETSLVKDGFKKIKENLLIRNLYEFGTQGLELDFLVFQLVDQLHANFTTSSSVDRWLEVRHEVYALLQAYEGLRKIRDSVTSSQFLTGRFFSNIFETIEEGIYQAHLTSNKARLKALNEQEAITPLGKYLRNLISKLPDNGQAIKDNPQLLALLSEIEGSENGLAMYNGIADKSGSTELLHEVGNLVRKYKRQLLPYKTGTIYGQEVYMNLRGKIEQYLPNYPEYKLEGYFRIVEEVIRYARISFVDNDRRRFPFLYAKDAHFKEGKGKNAIEQDLQDSMLRFFEHSRIRDGLDHEKARFVDGGRVDILYKKDLITIPIELKKSLNRPSVADLESNYIAQAQTYTAGYDQLGIFVLLELSEKALESPPNFKDWFKIHHLPASSNTDIEYPDYVISVVIPGNRTSPSLKSRYK